MVRLELAHHIKKPFQITTEMMIPPDKCGLIIGKGGNTLKTMMQEHSVKLHLVQVNSTSICFFSMKKIHGRTRRNNFSSNFSFFKSR